MARKNRWQFVLPVLLSASLAACAGMPAPDLTGTTEPRAMITPTPAPASSPPMTATPAIVLSKPEFVEFYSTL